VQPHAVSQSSEEDLASYSALEWMRWGEPQWWVGEVTEVLPGGMTRVKKRARLYNHQWQQSPSGEPALTGIVTYCKLQKHTTIFLAKTCHTHARTDTHAPPQERTLLLSHTNAPTQIYTRTHTHRSHCLCETAVWNAWLIWQKVSSAGKQWL
jgi:hypothetical protein